MRINQYKIKLIGYDSVREFPDIVTFSSSYTSSIVLHEDGFYFKSIHDRYFVRVSDGTICFSKNLSLLVNSDIDIINIDSIAFYKEFGFLYPPFTQYNDIFLCSPYIHFSIKDNQLKTESLLLNISINDDINSDHIKNDIEINLKSFIDRDKEKTNKYAILVSGGIDSSLLLGISNSVLNLYNAFMCKMSSFIDEESRARKQCDFISLKFDLIDLDKNLDCSANKFLNYTGELISDPIALVFIEMFQHVFDKATQHNVYLVDGQGADSLFNGLPHDKLYDLWLKTKRFRFVFSWSRFFSMPKNKSSLLRRKFYRIIKVCKCLSEYSFARSIVISLSETGKIPKGVVYNRFVSDLDLINKHYSNWHVTLKYLFMFRVLSSREMQKYLFCDKYNISMVMPFLNDAIVDKYICLDPKYNIIDGVYKYPLKLIVDHYWPNMFVDSSTSPFQVNYTLKENSIKDVSLSFFNIHKV